MIEFAERLNIKNLTVEHVPQRRAPFIAERDVSQEDWNKIKANLEHFSNTKLDVQTAQALRAAKIAFPNKFDEVDFRLPESLGGDTISTNLLISCSLAYISPDAFNRYFENPITPEFLRTHIADMRRTQSIFELASLFPERVAELATESRKTSLELSIGKAGREEEYGQLAYDLACKRILFNDADVPDDLWADMLKEIKSQRLINWYQVAYFLELARDLSILSAEKVEIGKASIKLTFPEEAVDQNPALPVKRRF